MNIEDIHITEEEAEALLDACELLEDEIYSCSCLAISGACINKGLDVEDLRHKYLRHRYQRFYDRLYMDAPLSWDWDHGVDYERYKNERIMAILWFREVAKDKEWRK